MPRFDDLQDTANPRNGSEVANAADLSELLASFRGRTPFIFTLESENSRWLTVGVGQTAGFVQWSALDGTAWIAVNDSNLDKPGCVDFLAGGTPTPVPMRYCHSMQAVEGMVATFVKTWKWDPAYKWEFSVGPD